VVHVEMIGMFRATKRAQGPLWGRYPSPCDVNEHVLVRLFPIPREEAISFQGPVIPEKSLFGCWKGADLADVSTFLDCRFSVGLHSAPVGKRIRQ
jgi:hypothetical protein